MTDQTIPISCARRNEIHAYLVSIDAPLKKCCICDATTFGYKNPMKNVSERYCPISNLLRKV